MLMSGLTFADQPATDSAGRVAGHLAAGEFGPAMDVAMKVADPVQRAALVQDIADAQAAAGEPVTAAATLSRISRNLPNASTSGPKGRGGFSGGGTMADFRTLMNMIETNTSGKWMNVDSEGGSQSPYPYGVHVSPNGLLHRLTSKESSNLLASLGMRARQADLNADVARHSDLRLVSLTRLEKAVAQRLSDGLTVPETMAQLAGLSQIKYVMVYPESKEIVIGGPADAWQYNAQGQPVSTSTGRPTLQLDDLVTVLRTFARNDADFGCSINTRDDGVRALTDFVQKSQARGPLNSKSVRNWVKQLQEKLGRQDIEVWGVPADSRVARVIVEADYRMKLIGIDKLKAGKEIPSYFDLLSTAQPKEVQTMDALRWWLTMKYDAVTHSADKNVFEIQGSSVLCQSENQFLTAEGKHVPTGQSEPTNRAFAQNFTANYETLATRDPVFADMQNIFDLALVSALIQHERLHDKAGWDLGAFTPRGDYATARYAVPKEIDSVVNHRVYNGRDIVVQVAGGVRGDVMSVVKDPKLTPESPRLGSLAKTAQAPELPTGRWWWDAVK
ncbi:MAG: DUF1598 domain-containing protein [Planctomycetes bacterium]|nr:DUF1598 domain-containing protein [Planctomycetota bacterium]